MRMRIAKAATCTNIETTTVQGLLVLAALALETTISSNMGPTYLLPAGARRGEAPSLPLGLMPAAGPVATTPWPPRQRFQATTKGAAIPKLEYVPTTIPT